ncbi:hypothetical protein YTXLTZUM_CDS0169 [Enterococcus phage VRE9_3]
MIKLFRTLCLQSLFKFAIIVLEIRKEIAKSSLKNK